MKTEDTKPWYKQFWPWFIISIPLASVIAGINMIVISVDGADSLVNKDYYKDGLAINKQFDKVKQAETLGISGTLSLIENKLSLTLKSDKPITENLSIHFNHATIEAKDFMVKLQQTSNGNYFVFLDQDKLSGLNGKWYLQLTPYSDTWQLKSSWVLPSKAPLALGK